MRVCAPNFLQNLYQPSLASCSAEIFKHTVFQQLAIKALSWRLKWKTLQRKYFKRQILETFK